MVLAPKPSTGTVQKLPSKAARLPGWGGSLVLHGLALALIFVFLARHSPTPGPPLKPLYIEIVPEVPLGAHSAAPVSVPSHLPQFQATHGRRAAPRPQGVRRHGTEPLRDPFELKLRRLAELRNPDSTLSLKTEGTAAQTAGTAGEPGDLTYSVRDAIRARVLRKWNIDFGRLAGRHIIVTLHVSLTGSGRLASISIANERAHAKDLTWMDIALSARNAVILSAPFALPIQLRRKGFSFTITLDPRETLH
ncbi:MAG: hypothetical protein KGO02_06960 [Alphaproteobacteria bacterium]|nr:hypothetical protein [Alphaproteobacteria bacterium]